MDYKNRYAVRIPRTKTENLNDQQRLDVLQYYLTHRDNSISAMHKHFGFPVSRIGTVIDEYLRDKCIIIESKINQIKHDEKTYPIKQGGV